MKTQYKTYQGSAPCTPDETSNQIVSVASIHQSTYEAFKYGQEHGLLFRQVDAVDDLNVTMNGKSYLSFVKMSYLGIPSRLDMITMVKKSIDHEGLARHSTRAFVDPAQFRMAGKLLSTIFGGSILITKSISDASICLMTSLIGPEDALVLDKHVHYNVHHASAIAVASGTHRAFVKHADLKETLEVIRQLAKKKRTVWFCTDGIYSMNGDFLPTDFYKKVLDIASNVYLYVDDAHGTSWTGKYGCGHFLSHLSISNRMIVAESLGKGFGAKGGCLVFSSQKQRDLVYTAGTRHFYSVSLYPPELAAIIASARIHLSEELPILQLRLKQRNRLLIKLLTEAEVPLVVKNDSPIHCVPLGSNKKVIQVAKALQKKGFLVGLGYYPLVPREKGVIRINLTASHTQEDIAEFCKVVAEVYHKYITRQS